jgi:hypothetical protein
MLVTCPRLLCCCSRLALPSSTIATRSCVKEGPPACLRLPSASYRSLPWLPALLSIPNTVGPGMAGCLGNGSIPGQGGSLMERLWIREVRRAARRASAPFARQVAFGCGAAAVDLPRVFRTVELCYFMLRAARLGIRCGPHAGSGSLTLSGAVADYRIFQYSGQYRVSLSSGSDKRCGAPARF